MQHVGLPLGKGGEGEQEDIEGDVRYREGRGGWSVVGSKLWGGGGYLWWVVINLATTGGNKRREWVDVQQTNNGLFLRLPLRSRHIKVSYPQRCSVSFLEE